MKTLLYKWRLGSRYLLKDKFNPFHWGTLNLCVCLYEWRYLGEVRCVNTDSIHIVCSTNCVYCTVTNPAESQHSQASSYTDTVTSQTAGCLPTSDEPSQTEYSVVSDEPSETEYSFISDEPYTSEKLSRLRSGYRLLSASSVVVKFNFNNPQVCNSVLMLFSL